MIKSRYEAKNALLSCNYRDLIEARSLRFPPDTLRFVFDTINIILQNSLDTVTPKDIFMIT